MAAGDCAGTGLALKLATNGAVRCRPVTPRLSLTRDTGQRSEVTGQGSGPGQESVLNIAPTSAAHGTLLQREVDYVRAFCRGIRQHSAVARSVSLD